MYTSKKNIIMNRILYTSKNKIIEMDIKYIIYI